MLYYANVCRAASFGEGRDVMEEKRKILFYGDSNTYGYDPADWLEYRYCAEKRWTYQLQEMCGDAWTVIPEGMNGRRLPDLIYDGRRILSLTGKLSDEDVFAVMLGTNDLLVTTDPDADEAVRRMDALLAFLTGRMDAKRILVIAPPHIAGSGIRDFLYKRYHEESVRMNAGFREAAGRYEVMFADAGLWNIGLCFDQVHFSEEGHRVFAERMAQFLTEMDGLH